MGMFSSVNYKTVATRITPRSKTFKILSYILMAEGASKYEFVTNVLGKKGSKQELRGYYCVWCENMIRGGVLTLENGVYNITDLGRARVRAAILRARV